jgi:hypothetical protein
VSSVSSTRPAAATRSSASGRAACASAAEDGRELGFVPQSDEEPGVKVDTSAREHEGVDGRIAQDDDLRGRRLGVEEERARDPREQIRQLGTVVSRHALQQDALLRVGGSGRRDRRAPRRRDTPRRQRGEQQEREAAHQFSEAMARRISVS